MARTTFAAALKQAREAAGLSQAELARRAGLTGSYISVLESRRRRPPTRKVIRALCKALDIPEGPLQEAADIERSPAGVRRRLERLRRERGRGPRAGDRILATTLFHLARGPRVVDPLGQFMDLPPDQHAVLAGMLGRLRRARTVEEAEEEVQDVLDETPEADREALVRLLPEVLAAAPPAEAPSAPATAKGGRRVPVRNDPREADAGGEALVLDGTLAPEGAFLWRAATSDGHPRIEHGDLVLVVPDRAPKEGDLVLFRHEKHWRLGLFHREADAIRLAFPRPELPPLRLPRKAFDGAGVITLVVRAL